MIVWIWLLLWIHVLGRNCSWGILHVCMRKEYVSLISSQCSLFKPPEYPQKTSGLLMSRRGIQPIPSQCSFLYPLKTENRKVFRGVEKECIRNEWVKGTSVWRTSQISYRRKMNCRLSLQKRINTVVENFITFLVYLDSSPYFYERFLWNTAREVIWFLKINFFAELFQEAMVSRERLVFIYIEKPTLLFYSRFTALQRRCENIRKLWMIHWGR